MPNPTTPAFWSDFYHSGAQEDAASEDLDHPPDQVAATRQSSSQFHDSDVSMPLADFNTWQGYTYPPRPVSMVQDIGFPVLTQGAQDTPHAVEPTATSSNVDYNTYSNQSSQQMVTGDYFEGQVSHWQTDNVQNNTIIERFTAPTIPGDFPEVKRDNITLLMECLRSSGSAPDLVSHSKGGDNKLLVRHVHDMFRYWRDGGDPPKYHEPIMRKTIQTVKELWQSTKSLSQMTNEQEAFWDSLSEMQLRPDDELEAIKTLTHYALSEFKQFGTKQIMLNSVFSNVEPAAGKRIHRLRDTRAALKSLFSLPPSTPLTGKYTTNKVLEDLDYINQARPIWSDSVNTVKIIIQELYDREQIQRNEELEGMNLLSSNSNWLGD
ncbi:uncharacterized protein L199_007810 [Kwoniella botswanensis]|uniref:uncharacterized protein n=1 Tax=Kwoniella botswanensis TaxID=1268659 RepID=UPI00315DBA69